MVLVESNPNPTPYIAYTALRVPIAVMDVSHSISQFNVSAVGLPR